MINKLYTIQTIQHTYLLCIFPPALCWKKLKWILRNFFFVVNLMLPSDYIRLMIRWRWRIGQYVNKAIKTRLNVPHNIGWGKRQEVCLDSSCPGQDSNHAPPKHVAEMSAPATPSRRTSQHHMQSTSSHDTGHTAADPIETTWQEMSLKVHFHDKLL